MSLVSCPSVRLVRCQVAALSIDVRAVTGRPAARSSSQVIVT
jgi:hypothetical protein